MAESQPQEGSVPNWVGDKVLTFPWRPCIGETWSEVKHNENDVLGGGFADLIAAVHFLP
jgi:hypothetical protein